MDILCMGETEERVSKQSKHILNPILFLKHWRGLFQVKAGITDRPAEIKFLMQNLFIQGFVTSALPSFTPRGDTATFQVERAAAKGKICLLKVLSSPGLFLPPCPLFISYLCTRVIWRNFILLQRLFFKWSHEKLSQCQNKQYILMISITTDLELAFFLLLFCPSQPLSQTSKGSWVNAVIALHSLGLMAGLSWGGRGHSTCSDTDTLWSVIVSPKLMMVFSLVEAETLAAYLEFFSQHQTLAFFQGVSCITCQTSVICCPWKR